MDRWSDLYLELIAVVQAFQVVGCNSSFQSRLITKARRQKPVIDTTYKLDPMISSASQAFSPWMVATTLRLCRLVLNSRNQIPCQVPVFNLPFVMGMLTEAPTRADLICAWLTVSGGMAGQVQEQATYRHVVLSLRGVSVQISFSIRRGNPVERVTHIGADIVVPVLVQGEGTAGVLDEEVQHPDLVVAEFGELGDDMVGDEVGAARARGESEGFLEPGHGGGLRVETEGEESREKQSSPEDSCSGGHGGVRHCVATNGANPYKPQRLDTSRIALSFET